MNAAKRKLKLFSGSAHPELSQEIASYLGIELGKAQVSKFKNGETQVLIEETVRGADCFIVQSTCNPVNDNVIELLIMADAMKRASCRAITAIIPYYAYARQDRKTRGREPISAKLMADLYTTAGISRVITMDLHADQIQGFFNIPVDHLRGVPTLAKHIAHKKIDNLVVVSPDLGGVTRARIMADMLHASIAIIEKRRPRPGVAEVANLIGDVEGKTAVLIDDMVDSAGSLCEAAVALKKMGAKDVYACATHAILSDPAIENIQKSVLKEVIVTNTIPLEAYKRIPKIVSLSVAPIIAKSITRIFGELSMSELFAEEQLLK
ncbi:MAG: ribose-phosphate pyrophosphokinase [Negativicutes bacterium]|jgi:ribose-phosphate pyrophosphokinase